MVLMLREAVVAYQQDTGRYPEGSADEALVSLLNRESSKRILAGWPASGILRRTDVRLVDPWGGFFRYITARDVDSMRQRRVSSDAGVPIFESAGADGVKSSDIAGNTSATAIARKMQIRRNRGRRKPKIIK